jgi:NAD(P)-dependent dehydrogenase (short-subunit alcohol dehydrogenase family)
MSVKINDLFSVAGKTVVITGGSRGIGEMIARAYVENGANVILTSRKASDVEGLAAKLGTPQPPSRQTSARWPKSIASPPKSQS